MSPQIASVLAAAELLTADEQRELIDLLAVGLDDPSPAEVETVPTALPDAWREEIARRSAEYDAGLAETVSWQEVQARWQTRGTAGE